jgi:energy-converting hydrogenase Eha subunit A
MPPTSKPLEAHMSSPSEIQSRAQQVELPARSKAPLGLRIGFWACIVISGAVVLRRIFALAFPSSSAAPPPFTNLDSSFASHAVLTLAHIIPALAFVLLLPIVLLRPPGEASWAERILFPLGVVVGLTAYAMSTFAVGGWIERSAVLCFNTWFLFSLARAFLYHQRAELALEHRWLLRTVVVLLGIATTRPVMGAFFATSPLTHLTPNQFFGIAFWIGFSINAAVVEIWLHSGARRLRQDQIATLPAR